jgi:proliferating cell nuclear antigen
MDIKKNVLTMQTIQISPIRNLFSALKDLVPDVTMIMDKDGLKIINFDKNHTTLVAVRLKFEKYNCIPDKIVVCANSLHLFKLISNTSNDDLFSMFIEKDDYHDGSVSHLGLQYDNGKISQCNNYKLRLFEPEEEELEVPEVNYSAIIHMPSAGFQKIIRDLTGLSDRIRIESVGDDLIFSCVGPFAQSRIYRTEQKTDGGDANLLPEDKMDAIKFRKKPDPSIVMCGEFPLKSLNNFIKCTPLSQNLEIYLENNLPLIVKYDIGSNMGDIRLCLSPLPTVNYNYNEPQK